MTDDRIQELLLQADELFQAAGSPAAPSAAGRADFVEAVHRRRRVRQIRRRGLGALGVVLIVGGFWSWAWVSGLWRGVDPSIDAVAVHDAAIRETQGETTATQQVTTKKRLSNEEIARLKAEIAALDAEANRARQFVELYRAAESRRERLAVADAAASEPLLPPDVMAQLEIDRAAAITVISADSQASDFNRLDDAAESYRSVLKHFPDSRWASVARDRLAQVQHMN